MNEIAVIECLRRGSVLAASAPSTAPDRLAWVGVYPLDTSRQTTVEFLRNHGWAVLPKAANIYHVRIFEVQRALIDADASIAEEEMTNKRSYFAFGEEDLRRKIEALGLSLKNLDLPFRSDYPI